MIPKKRRWPNGKADILGGASPYSLILKQSKRKRRAIGASSAPSRRCLRSLKGRNRLGQRQHAINIGLKAAAIDRTIHYHWGHDAAQP